MKKTVFIITLVLAAWFMYAKDDAKIKNTGNGGRNVVAFGDSLTYGYGAPREGAYPAVLAVTISRPGLQLGRNGETSVGGAARIEEALAENPYMVLIEFGGNDVLRSVPFDRTVSAVENMVDAVQNAGAVAVIVATGGYAAMEPYTRAYRQIAREKGAVFVPSILKGVAGRRELMSDQIHPNAAGYEIVAEKVYKEIKDYL